MSTSAGRVAFVTGASRGIGRAAALHLADAGFDLALAARTLRPGEARQTYADGTKFSGSLEETAARVEEKGRRALPLYLDLTDRKSAEQAMDRCLAEWGRVDVLVNNALWSSQASHALVLDIDPDELAQTFDANIVTQLVLSQKAVRSMLERGEGGVLIDVSSGVATETPPARTQEGGWAFGYAAYKAGLTRLAPLLHVEHGADGIRAFALVPGGIATDSFKAAFPPEQLATVLETPGLTLLTEDVPASVIVWLATAPEAAELSGRTLYAERVCREHALLPEDRIAVTDRDAL